MGERYWIRKAQSSDLERVSRMWLALVEYEASLSPRFEVKPRAERLWLEEFTRDRAAGRAEVFLSETDEGEPSGFIHVRAVPGAPFHAEDRLGFVDAVWVEPAHRRHGIARKLVNTALVWCRERKLTVLEAGVVVANRTAVKAWEGIGFEMTSAVMTFRVDEGPPLVQEALRGEDAEADEEKTSPREARAEALAAFAGLPDAGWVLSAGAHVREACTGEGRRVVAFVPRIGEMDDHLADLIAHPAHLPFRGSSFSAVVCRRILERVEDPVLSAWEVARVLEPGAPAALDAVLGSEDVARARRHDDLERHRTPGHARFHTADAIRVCLTGAGLTVEAEESVYEAREVEEWLRETGGTGIPAERARDVAEKAALRPDEDPLGIQMRRVGPHLRFDERRMLIRARRS